MSSATVSTTSELGATTETPASSPLEFLDTDVPGIKEFRIQNMTDMPQIIDEWATAAAMEIIQSGKRPKYVCMTVGGILATCAIMRKCQELKPDMIVNPEDIIFGVSFKVEGNEAKQFLMEDINIDPETEIAIFADDISDTVATEKYVVGQLDEHAAEASRLLFMITKKMEMPGALQQFSGVSFLVPFVWITSGAGLNGGSIRADLLQPKTIGAIMKSQPDILQLYNTLCLAERNITQAAFLEALLQQLERYSNVFTYIDQGTFDINLFNEIAQINEYIKLIMRGQELSELLSRSEFQMCVQLQLVKKDHKKRLELARQLVRQMLQYPEQ